jgi:hypothetical protein
MVERRDAKPARRRFVFRPRRRLRVTRAKRRRTRAPSFFNDVSKPWCRSITLARAVARRALFYFCAAKSGMCSLAIVLGFLSPSPMLRNQLRKKCAPKMRPKNPFM